MIVAAFFVWLGYAVFYAGLSKINPGDTGGNKYSVLQALGFTYGPQLTAASEPTVQWPLSPEAQQMMSSPFTPPKGGATPA